MNNQIKYNNSIFSNATKLIIIMLVSLCVDLVIVINAPDKYMWIWLLPTFFAIFSLLFMRVFYLFGKSVTVTLLLSSMFLKNEIIPCFMALGDGAYFSIIDTSGRILYAVALQIYEQLAIFVMLYVMYRKLSRSLKAERLIPLNLSKKQLSIMVRITLLILLVVLGCIILYPQLVAYFTWGISGNIQETIRIAQLQSVMKEVVPALIYYLYSFLANLLRWAIPVSAIFWIYCANINNDTIKISLSFLVITVSALLTTNTKAISVFIVIGLSLLLCRQYYKQRKKIMVVSIALVVFVGVIGLFLKIFGSGGIREADIRNIANTLQAYFSGTDNVAVASKISMPLSIKEIIGDVFRFVPYIMSFFRVFTTSTEQFNKEFWGNSTTATQIIPMISQGARYFTVVLAPTFTVLICWIAIRWEMRINKKRDYFDYTICIIGCVCFSMAVAMYSASLCIQLYLNYVFPLQCMIWISRKLS